MRLHHVASTAVAALVLSTAGVAGAHVSFASGPAAANKTQKLTFGVGHGCEGADTIGIRIVIPPSITSIRPLRSDFGKPSVEKDGAGVITAVSWTKPASEFQDEDIGYYELTIRARVPDAPFTKIEFAVDQTCRAADGTITVVHWDEPPGSGGDEVAVMIVVPSHQAGWNRVVLGATTTLTDDDLPTYFGDSLIVWRGTAAYTPNANTLALIQGTPGVTVLSGGLVAGDEVWVKY